MTRTPDGSAKAAAENEDAVTNANSTNARARRSTAKSAKEGEVLPKAQPEDVSKPGDEAKSNPFDLDDDTDSKSDVLKDRVVEDLGKGAATAAELPAPVPAPNATVPEGQVEITTNAEPGELSDPAGRVTEQKKAPKARTPKKDPLKEIENLDKLPIAASVGDIVGSIEQYAGRPVLSLSLRGWVGDVPLKILAADIDQLEGVLAALREQLS